MEYIDFYDSPIGQIILTADEKGLTGIWFENSKNCPDESGYTKNTMPVFEETKHWLDIYFSCKNPNFTPKLNPKGTNFQLEVWKILLKIPYGKTITYNDIAKQIAKQHGIPKMSAQAVGGAVRHNNIPIIIPCHRVIGSNGNLTGFSAGLPIKEALLKLENSDYFATC